MLKVLNYLWVLMLPIVYIWFDESVALTEWVAWILLFVAHYVALKRWSMHKGGIHLFMIEGAVYTAGVLDMIAGLLVAATFVYTGFVSGWTFSYHDYFGVVWAVGFIWLMAGAVPYFILHVRHAVWAFYDV